MRATELCSLKIIDLDFSGKLPRLHLKIKGGELHAPLISDELANLLKKYVVTLRPMAKPEDPLFTLSPYSKRPLSRDYLARLVTAIAREQGIIKEITPHSCRATVASHLHRNGIQLSEIQDLLGHKSMMTTMMYIRKTDEEKESGSRKVNYSKVTKERGRIYRTLTTLPLGFLQGLLLQLYLYILFLNLKLGAEKNKKE